MSQSTIKDASLANLGEERIRWAAHDMPVILQLRERFAAEKPLKGQRIAAAMHVTTETANLMLTLVAGGAEITLSASNPLTTQDDVAAYLAAQDSITVHAVRGANRDEFYKQMNSTLLTKPTIIMDDGADLVSTLHTNDNYSTEGIIGGLEETTTGVIRIQSMARENVLHFPMIAVNDSATKQMFDNRYGTGQSTVDGIIRATNRLLAGSTFVVAGYGWCGRGLAMRASGEGANVIVTEVDPIKGLEAAMDGFRVLPMAEAAPFGDFFCTVTGNCEVIRMEHMEKMKDGAIICNSGHFDVEIDVKKLAATAKSCKRIRNYVDQYELPNGRTINLLAEGRLVNLAAAEGHPAQVMDMSFSDQALAAEYLVKNQGQLENKVHVLPKQVDIEVASLKLAAMGIHLDKLSERQAQYLSGWQEGT